MLLISLSLSLFTAPLPEPEPHLFDRVLVTGASISDGYGLRGELNAWVGLSDVISSAIRRDKAEVLGAADNGFFTAPTAKGTELLESLQEKDPTLVIAVDYLFWFAHGSKSSEKRHEMLELGLTLLDRIECPLVIGDFPNCSLALRGKGPLGGPVISRRMLPDEETRAKLNRRIHEWADERARVTVAPCAAYYEKIVSEEDLELRGNVWKGNSTDAFLQEDLLHLTVQGTIGLSILLLDTIARSYESVDDSMVTWKATDVHDVLMERTREEREKNAEKERKREERRKRREEKKKKEQEAGGLAPAF